MKWLTNPDSGESMLAFTKGEVADIAKLLKYARRGVVRKYEHFAGLHEIGTATEKQQDLMFAYEELTMLIETVIKEAEQ